MNILLTAIGSMSAEAAIKSFRQFNNVKIVGCDIYPNKWLSNSHMVDTFYQIPKATEKDYLPTIIKLCKEHSIDFVVPLTDPEVDVLSRQRKHFDQLKAILCISNEQAINICRDKLKLYNYFKTSELVKVIPTYTSSDLSPKSELPLIAKPRNGRSSEGIFKIQRPGFMKKDMADYDNYIFQPVIQGTIITVDYIRSISGSDVSICRREFLRTSNGAGVTVETFYDEDLSKIASEIGKTLNIQGCINIEFIFDGGNYFLMDINPRYSAGVAFSILTGYDMCKNHIHAFIPADLDTLGKCEFGIYLKKYSEMRTQ